MIDTKELRIGNLIFDEDNDVVRISALFSEKYIKYNGIGDHDYNTESDTDDYNIFLSKVINSIPLTEEWLLKLGFTEIASDNKLSGFGTHRLDYDGYDDRTHTLFIAENMGGSWTVGGEANCILKYVHQLQNLYFALTGTELEK